MSNELVVMPKSDWEDILTSVRNKTGKTDLMTSDQVSAEVDGIKGGFPNGTEWTTAKVSDSCSKLTMIHACANGILCAASSEYDNSSIYYTTDGKAWTRSNLTSSPVKAIANANGIWVAIAGDADNEGGIYYSTDGKVWTQSNIITANKGYSNLVYAKGRWVTYNFTDQILYYSEDGKVWEVDDTVIFSNVVNQLVYVDGVWIAYRSGRACDVYYSLDGVTWAQSNLMGGNVGTITNANGLWVATVNNDGIYYSTDGMEWIKSNVTGTGSALQVRYANGLWVTSYGSYLYYSTDGKTWTKGQYGMYSPLIYANGLWLADKGGLYYSTNGTTWTLGNKNINSSSTTIWYDNGIWLAQCNNTGIYYSTNGKTWTQSHITSGSYKFAKVNGVLVAVPNLRTPLYSIAWES